jgi:hypothetical protein
MALSPADFYAYSQATGAPIPNDPSERAQMAPEVLAFRRNQLKAPQQEEKQGFDPLSVGVGVGLALAGGVGAGLGIRRLMRGPKQSANAGVRQANLERFAEEASPVRRVAEETQVAPSKTVAPTTEVEPEYVSPYSKGPTYRDVYPSRFEFPKISEETLAARRQLQQEQAQRLRQLTPGTYQLELGGEVSPTLRQLRSSEFGPNITEVRREALGMLPDVSSLIKQASPEDISSISISTSRPLSAAPNQLNIFTEAKRDIAQELVDEYVRNASLEGKRQQKIQRDVATQKEGMAMRVIDQLREEARQERSKPQGFNPRQYIEQTGAVSPVEDLTSLQQLNEGQVIDQKINAVESGEDQMTGRMRQQRQRSNQEPLLDVEYKMYDLVASAAEKGFKLEPQRALAIITNPTIELTTEEAALFNIDPSIGKFALKGQTYAPGQQQTGGALSLKGERLKSVPNIGMDPQSLVKQAASGTSIRGRSRIQNEPEQFRQRISSSGRPLEDDFIYVDEGGTVTVYPGEELTELEINEQTSPSYTRYVRGSVTGEMQPEYAPKNMRAVRTKEGSTYYVPVSDPGGIGVYGEERSYASGPVTKFDDPEAGKIAGQYTKAAGQKPTDLPSWLAKKESTLFSNVSTEGLLRAQEKSTKSGARAIQSEIERRERTKESLEVSEALRRARIEGRDPQEFLRRKLKGDF